MRMLLAAVFVIGGTGLSFSAVPAGPEEMRAADFLSSAAAEDAPAGFPSAVPGPEPVDLSTGPQATQLVLNNISNNQTIPVGHETLIEGAVEGPLAGEIRRITVLFEGETICDALLSGPAFSFRYSFPRKADLGRLELVAFDASGGEIAETVYYVNVVEPGQPDDRYFSKYLLKAVEWTEARYGLKGYDINSVLTHDIVYHTSGTIVAKNPPLTMCVAAQMELMLIAYQLYAQESGDYSPYAYLPKRSYEGQSASDLKGHIWVNHEFHSYGTADALINFGMGERTVFEALKPGSFVNINRTNKTGHAVLFLGFIDAKGNIQEEHNSRVVGFKYYSSQGKSKPGQGGFDYRYAVFDKYGCPELLEKRDCKVIYSTNQNMLNTGTMLAPKFWKRLPPDAAFNPGNSRGTTVFDAARFNGVTTDD